MKNSSKIVVVGGGIFGTTCAIKLAEQGYEVDLFEKNDDILKAASSINQYRLHRGYHYPRSPETIISSRDAEQSFREEFPETILQDTDHYYCIAKEGSFTSAEGFLNMCRSHNLEFKIVEPDFVVRDKIELCVKVDEVSLDPVKLKEICWKRLKQYKVNVILNTEVDASMLNSYKMKVLCTYANLNALLTHLPEIKKSYQFELCEKPVLKLPNSSFENKSVVVMDGPFMCIDPYGATGLFIMGHVSHAIHNTNVGHMPIIDDKFKQVLNNGVIKNFHITNFEAMRNSGKEFIPALERAEHVGSMFTIRTVLPYNDNTDRRPTIVETFDKQTITVFSGKIGNCVKAAKDVVAMVS